MGQLPWIFIGIVFAFFGAFQIFIGELTSREGVELPAWAGWVLLPFGLWILFFSIRAMRCSKNTPISPVNNDEDAARAEAEMDAMYLREHGELPEKPKKDE